jgi:hypothetical protein
LGRYRRIDVPGVRGTAAARIDDHGEIVGFYRDTHENPNTAADDRGFLLDRRGRGHHDRRRRRVLGYVL